MTIWRSDARALIESGSKKQQRLIQFLFAMGATEPA
jgi:hypothetical protein